MNGNKYSAKGEILKIFLKYRDRELSSKDVYEIARQMNIFIPPAFNTHLSQLLKRGDLTKVRRSVYKLNQELYPAPKEEEKNFQQKSLF